MESLKGKASVYVASVLFYFLMNYCNSFIIPNELPSLLSIIYSNIPPVKVGKIPLSWAALGGGLTMFKIGCPFRWGEPETEKPRAVDMARKNAPRGPLMTLTLATLTWGFGTRTGFDTRFGLGFRLGPHADYQTLIEIGPQTNTNPLSPNGTVSKRQSNTAKRLHRLQDLTENAVANIDKNSSQKGPGKGKKSEKTLVGKIEFKRIPGIDDVSDHAKTFKNEEERPMSSPTKFVLL